MSTLRRRAATAGVALLLAAVSAACGPSVSADRPDPSPSPDAAATTSSAAPERGFAEEMIAWHWQVEEETARCMAERGFEYVPYVPQRTIDNLRAMYGENRIEISPDDDRYWVPLFPMESSPGSAWQEEQALEEARTNGFGIFFDPPGLSQAEREIESERDDTDPNGAIIDSLGDAERDEYYWALQGDKSDADGSSLENSCSETALRVAGPEPTPPMRLDGVDIEKLTILGTKVSQAVQADPRLEAAEAEQVACLAERGQPPDPWSQIMSLNYAEFERLTGDAHGVLPETGRGKEADLAAALGEDKLREYQAMELAAAVAANECAMAYSQVERDVIRDYERQILAENPDVADLLGIDS